MKKVCYTERSEHEKVRETLTILNITRKGIPVSRTEILDAIRTLAMSQGWYGRFLEAIESLEGDEYEEVMTTLEEQDFKDMVDLVMYLEG